MNFKRIFFFWLSYVALFVCLLPVTIFIYKHPAYNFDMVGYMALVVRMDQTHDLNEIHRLTYASLEKEVPASDYEKLTNGLPVRKRFAEESSAFEKVLPIYSVKPLYVWLCYLFYKAGFPLSKATMLPSILGYLGIAFLLFSWTRKHLKTAIAFLLSLLMMCSMFVVAIAGHSTPDCLSSMFLFAASYFVLERQKTVWLLIFLSLSVLTRADNVITAFFILTFLTFNQKWTTIGKKQYFAWVGLLAAVYLLAIFPVTQFGWSIFYYSEYSRHIDFSRDFNDPVTFPAYWHMLFSKLVTALVSTQFTIFMLLSLLILGNPFAFRRFTFDQAYLFMLLFTIFFRFWLLPDLSDRFYFGFYLVIVVLLVKKYAPASALKMFEELPKDRHNVSSNRQNH